MDLNSRAVLLEDIEVIEDQIGAYLYKKGTGEVKVINRVGLLVLKMCDGTKSVEEIIMALSKNFPQVNIRNLTLDITGFLKAARQEKVIRIET